jgi:hypothetical protein
MAACHRILSRPFPYQTITSPLGPGDGDPGRDQDLTIGYMIRDRVPRGTPAQQADQWSFGGICHHLTSLLSRRGPTGRMSIVSTWI